MSLAVNRTINTNKHKQHIYIWVTSAIICKVTCPWGSFYPGWNNYHHAVALWVKLFVIPYKCVHGEKECILNVPGHLPDGTAQQINWSLPKIELQRLDIGSILGWPTLRKVSTGHEHWTRLRTGEIFLQWHGHSLSTIAQGNSLSYVTSNSYCSLYTGKTADVQ